MPDPSWIVTLLWGFTPARSRCIQSVDRSHPHFRSIIPYQIHSSIDGSNSHSKANMNPIPLLGFPTRRPNSDIGIPPTQRFGSSPCCASYRCSKSTHPICRWVTLSLQNPFQICKYSGKSL